MNLQEQLLEDGIKHGMCEKFQMEWGNPDLKELTKKYFAGQDFCIKNDWPSLEWLRKNIGIRAEEHGIFIDSNSNTTDRDMRNMAFLGECDAVVDAYDMCDITIRHNSSVTLNAHAGCFVYVSLHGDALLDIKSKADGARICVSHFSGHIINQELIDRYHNKMK